MAFCAGSCVFGFMDQLRISYSHAFFSGSVNSLNAQVTQSYGLSQIIC
uniref:Uncharacterized protein n=1 Tax=Anguilla anguilla TaxID=7936 RepID=A0A0E9T2R2_ANGAN